MVCDVVPYTECEMLMEMTPYRSFEVMVRQSTKKVCTAGTDIVKHTKLMPECRNVTKQNCITKWETDAYGKQVWAGNEACEPVTWKECKYFCNFHVNMLVGVEAAGKAQPSVSLSHATRILSCPGWPVPPRLPSLPFSCPSMALTTPPNPLS